MYRRIMILTIGCAICLLATAFSSSAADSEQITQAFDRISETRLDVSTTIDVKDLIFEHQDMLIRLKSGRLAFLEPVEIDGTSHRFGAYFDGNGTFQFLPPNQMEQSQLQRFFGVDSLNRSFESLLMLFDTTMYVALRGAGKSSEELFDDDDVQSARDRLDEFQNDIRRPYIFTLLTNLTAPTSVPYLLVNVYPDDLQVTRETSRIYYEYNPYAREEIKLYTSYRRPGRNYMELVCSYWKGNADETYSDINGPSKDRIKVRQYTTDVSIDGQAQFDGRIEMEFEVTAGPTQLLPLDFHPRLHLDSVIVEGGARAGVSRFKKQFGVNVYESDQVGLILDRPYLEGETVKLTFFAQGNISERSVSDFLIDARDNWYPRYGYSQRAGFDMTFHTPAEYVFVATCTLQDEKKKNGILTTRWKVLPAARNVTCDLGKLDKYIALEEGVCPVDVYYLKDLHRDSSQALTSVNSLIGQTKPPTEEADVRIGTEVIDDEPIQSVVLGKDMEKQVAEDVVNAVKLFSHYFGPYLPKRLAVTEVMGEDRGAVPGIVPMASKTWFSTDSWGLERIFRASQVARQWWGVGVGYESYHDKWLESGLCEYCGLMYLQAAEGNDKFLERIRDYRDEIYAVQSFKGDAGEEYGPLALGDRTANVNKVLEVEKHTDNASEPSQDESQRRLYGYQEYGDLSAVSNVGMGKLETVEQIKSSRDEKQDELIIDKKAALVFHMLRNMMIDLQTMNEDQFFSMMKEFYDANRGHTVSTAEFKTLVEKYVGYDMGWFFDQWVYRDELPTYEFSYTIEPDDDGGYKAKCRVVTTGVREDFMMVIPLQIEIDKTHRAYIRAYVDEPVYEFTLPGLPQKPRKLYLNPFESVLAKVKQ